MRSKHPGGGMHHRCTSAGLPASMAFRWRKSPCRPSLSQKNTTWRERMAQICGKSKKSEQAGVGARTGAFESTGRTHIRRIYEKVETHSKLERIGLIDRHRRYRQAKGAGCRNTAVFTLMRRQGIPPGPRERPFPRCCGQVQPELPQKRPKVCVII